MYELIFSKQSEKFFLKLRLSDKKKISKSIDKLIKDPLIGEKLKGEYEGLWKIKAWPYRIIYLISAEQKVITIVEIGHRQGFISNSPKFKEN